MAGRKTGAEVKKKEYQGPKNCVIQNGKYPEYLTGIVENDKSGKVFTYGTLLISKALRFTEEEAREIGKECHGRVMIRVDR